MSELLRRLYNIARTFGPKEKKAQKDWFEQDLNAKPSASQDHHQDTRQSFSTGRDDHHPDFNFPDQVIKDLANFNLKPPASLEEVRQARNLEFKKYHPDKHMGDPEKAETAKQIMQIYNASYERLKEFYKIK